MRIESLRLKNFRNIKQCEFKPSKKLNFLIGNNGQGKTSFLEAVSFLSSLRSFRGAKAEDVIQWGDQISEVSCILSSDETEGVDWKTEFKVVFSTQEKTMGGTKTTKTAFINQKPFRSSAQYIRSRFGSWELGFHTISFNPSDHELVQGEPSMRRAYLDRVLSSENSEYLEALQKYQRALHQKNELLKSQKKISSEELFGFSETLCRQGSLITLKRIEWVKRLNSKIGFYLQKITQNHPRVTVGYFSKWALKTEDLSIYNNGLDSSHLAGQEGTPSLEQIETAFRFQLSALEQRELKLKVSLVGPHRDDWVFFLDRHALKGCGSQGETRSALLALKLTEIELFKASTGHRPVLLLDDFSSELDLQRRKFLLDFLLETELQVFVTSTDEFLTGSQCYRVSEGALIERNN